MTHDAELHNYTKVEDFFLGQIFEDKRGRFKNGDSIRTSKTVWRRGNILVTQNTTYLLAEASS